MSLSNPKLLVERFFEESSLGWGVRPQFDYSEAASVCKYVKKLEAENAELRDKVGRLETLVDELLDEAAHLHYRLFSLDCSICGYAGYCKQKDTEVGPKMELCKEAILEYCKTPY